MHPFSPLGVHTSYFTRINPAIVGLYFYEEKCTLVGVVSLTSYIPHGLTLYVVTVQVKMWPGGNKWSSVWRYRLLQLRSLFDMIMITDFFIFLGLPPWSKFGTQVNNLACPHLPHWNTFIEATPNCFTDQELILSGLLHVCNEHMSSA